MKPFYISKLTTLIAVIALSGCGMTAFAQTTTTFSTPSSSAVTYVVPAGVTGICVDLAGAQGGDAGCCTYGTGGKGGRVQATVAVTPGQTLYIYVGGRGTAITGSCCSTTGAGGVGGATGGASGAYYYPAGGGGSSEIRSSSTISGRILVAGGGGGGGSEYCSGSSNEAGGAGGGTTGATGQICNSTTYISGWEPSGGSQTTGGYAPSLGTGAPYAGTQTSGGAGIYYAGGGGGGFWGGGGGYEYAGGGGGSSYPAADGVTLGGNTATGVTHTQGYQAGAGYVSITAPNVGTVGGNTPLCTGQTMTLTPTVSGGTWSSQNSAIASVTSGGVVTANSAGSVNITYTANATCGSGYVIVPVLVNPSPAAIVGTPNVCAGLTTTLTDATSGGTWSSTVITKATISSGGVVSGIAAGTTIISYTITSTGCASVMPFTVNALPPAITGAATVCAAGSTTALADAAPGGTWTSSVPATATVTGTGIVTGLVAGNTTITYTLPTGCLISQIVTVNPLPGAITGTGIVCAGANTTLSDAGGGTWSSSNTSLAAVTPSGGVVTGVAAGTPNITYTLPTGCFVTTSILVNAVPAPITGTPNVCAGGTTTLSNTTPGGIWTSSNTSSATVLPVGGTVTGVATGTPIISYTLGTGCSATIPFVVNPLPVAYNVTGGGGYCVGAPGTHVGLSFGSSGINYKLFNGATLVATVPGSNSGLDFGLQSATGTYTATAVDASTGCTSSMTGSTTISVNPLPSVYSLAGGGSYCLGTTAPGMTLSGSDASVSYQLYVGGVPVGTAMTGTGGVLSFGPETTAGSYTAVGTNSGTGCASNMSGSASVTINAGPTVYNLSAGGGYCAGGTGVDVVLSGSDLSTTYQLLYGGVATGSPVAGTGSPLHFGPHTTAGAYTATAINTSTGCTATMAGSTHISINSLPVIYLVTGGGAYCAGGTGVHIGLNYSDPTVNYQLYRGSVPVPGTLMSGTSSGLDFGLQTTAGTYTVGATDQVTGCTQNMSGSAAVSTTPVPTAYTVTGGGSYCAGGSGEHIGLSGSATGIRYQLFNGITPVGSALNGTGGTLDFGLKTSSGTYTVVATNLSTSCSNNMTSSATVAINPVPSSYLVTGSGTSYCAGGAGIDVTLSGSDGAGISYQLYKGATAIGSPMTGTTASLNFGFQTTPGTYTVTATDILTHCSLVMAGNAPVAVNALPTAYTVTGGGAYCMGGLGVHIGLSNSTSGVVYQLFNTTGAVGTPVAGLGTSLDFGFDSIVDNYKVAAMNSLTGCTDTMTGSVAVTENMLPNVHNITGGGNYCIGGTGVHVGLDLGDAGIKYQLYLGTGPVGSIMTGDGTSAIDFGMFSGVGTYSVKATDPSTSCVATMSGTESVGTFPLPPSFTVTGGGTYCAPGAGLNINLAGSDPSDNYQLYYMGSPVGPVIAGTGSGIGFGLHTAVGTYNIKAVDNTTFCQSNMSGSASIATLPAPTVETVIGGGGYCTGGTGRTIGLGSSDAGISYQLYNGGVPVGGLVTGSGLPINFGLQTALGTYTVVASPGGLCQTTMTGTATISVNPLPNVYALTGGGAFCAGGTGVSVGLTNSDAGVRYQLYLGATPVTGGIVNGTGAAVSFGLQTSTGTYKVSATDTTTGCVTPAGTSGSLMVTSTPAPAVFNVTGGGNFCTGGSGVHVTLAGSATDVNYQLYYNGSTTGSPMAGTGTLLDFGLQTGAGSYTVMAKDAATLCTSTMADTATVGIDPIQNPSVSIVAHPGLTIKMNQRDTLVATATTAGTDPKYQWFVNGFPISGATNAHFVSHNFADSDHVSCQVTSNGGPCTGNMSSSSVLLHVINTTGVQTIVSNDIDVNVVPNPNRGTFSLTGSMGTTLDQDITIDVVDLLGHVVYASKSVARNGNVDERIQLSNVANGMYILNLRSGSDSKVFHVVIAQ